MRLDVYKRQAEMYGIAYEPQAVGIGFDILDANGQYVYGTEIYDIVCLLYTSPFANNPVVIRFAYNK